jgi:hypothetical protein
MSDINPRPGADDGTPHPHPASEPATQPIPAAEPHAADPQGAVPQAAGPQAADPQAVPPTAAAAAGPPPAAVHGPPQAHFPGPQPAYATAYSPIPSRPGWRDRRVPLLALAATLVLGCVLGAGAATIGALVVGDRHDGPDRIGVSRGEDGHGFGKMPRGPRGNWPQGRDGQDRGDYQPGRPGDQPVPGPSNPAPVPSASS